MLRLTTSSPEQTTALGRKLGAALERPVAFMLAGSYGTGKTTFAQGLAQGLGVEGLVRSPSYSIVRTYIGGKFGFVHADLYRVKSSEDIFELGLNDILQGDNVIAVEWPSTVEGFSLDLPTVEMTFSFVNEPGDNHSKDLEQTRVIRVDFSTDWPVVLREMANAFTA